MRRTKAEAEETRNSILHAAERVFFEKGVSNASLDDVAKAAGVTRGAIYWHFSNKTDLFLELYNTVNLPLEDMIARNVEQPAADVLCYIEKSAGDWLDELAVDEHRQRIFSILLRCAYTGDLQPVLESSRKSTTGIPSYSTMPLPRREARVSSMATGRRNLPPRPFAG